VLEGGEIVHVDDERTEEGTNGLSKPIKREFCPREASVNGQRQRHGRVKMSSRDAAGNINASRQTQSEPKVDADPSAVGTTAEDGGSDGTAAENDENGGTKHLSCRLTRVLLETGKVAFFMNDMGMEEMGGFRHCCVVCVGSLGLGLGFEKQRVKRGRGREGGRGGKEGI